MQRKLWAILTCGVFVSGLHCGGGGGGSHGGAMMDGGGMMGSSVRIASVSPADGAADVSRDAPVVLTFSEAMDTASVESRVSLLRMGTTAGKPRLGLPGPPLSAAPIAGTMASCDMGSMMSSTTRVAGAYSWNVDRTMMSFHPDGGMEGDCDYMVHVDGGMHAASGHGMDMCGGAMMAMDHEGGCGMADDSAVDSHGASAMHTWCFRTGP